jgi:hypothetical protein
MVELVGADERFEKTSEPCQRLVKGKGRRME